MVVNQRSSSIKGRLPSKVVFQLPNQSGIRISKKICNFLTRNSQPCVYKHWENWVLYCSVMLVHNAHAVYRSKYITEKVDACANIVALFLSVPCPWLQRRCSCQKYSYIPTLFMTVLCSILCKCKLLTQRLTAKFLLHPQLGGTSGVSECTHVLYVHCTFILGSARALTSLYRQYRRCQNHCQKLLS